MGCVMMNKLDWGGGGGGGGGYWLKDGESEKKTPCD